MGERKDGEERKRRATGGKEWEKGGEKGKRRHNKQREEEKGRGDIKWTDKKRKIMGGDGKNERRVKWWQCGLTRPLL